MYKTQNQRIDDQFADGKVLSIDCSSGPRNNANRDYKAYLMVNHCSV